MTEFYVYIYFRRDGTPCYIGKGQGRRYLKHERGKTNEHLWNIIRKSDKDLPKAIIKSGMTEAEAYSLEALLIEIIGREVDGGPLVNLSTGGVGSGSGCVRDAAWRMNRSEKAKEYWSNPENKLKLSERMRGNQHKKGKPNSELQKKVTADRLRGTPAPNRGKAHSDEAKNKMSLAHKGVPKSETHKEAIRKSLIGGTFTEERKNNISKALKNRCLSESHKEAIREGWAKRRQRLLGVE
jgi:hypothetical protein